MKDIPSRRLASVFEFALTLTIGYAFLARRYGPWVGGVAAGALLLMPRVYGDAHIAGTDTPGLLLWAATALAFWKGLREPDAGRWRVLVGVLLGLAFVEKMGAVLVLVPLLAWLVFGHLPGTFTREGGRAAWIDGVTTTFALLCPLVVAFGEILRIKRDFPAPDRINLFDARWQSPLPGLILAAPLGVWVVRRLLGRAWRGHPVWGVERPALEIWTAVLAFAPVIGWLGNPAWWRATLPRLAHYYAISSGRRGALPDIYILYWGRTYAYSLPWHNAWVLIAITVPVTILLAALGGLAYTFWNRNRARIPLYFLLHLITLPAIRMLKTPAHDGVRLFLPTFFFLAAFAGWGAIWAADGLARRFHARAAWWRGAVAALVLVPAAWQLVRVHPFELSYYNELIGGPRGAWKAGFELSYWYDAFNTRTLNEINAKLPQGAVVGFLNDKTNPDTFHELQALGYLRKDIVMDAPDFRGFPYVWLLTQDSKASSFTRLLFEMTPWYARRPGQLDGLRVATVADPVAVSRAWMLRLLLETPSPELPEPPAAPVWVRRYVPWLGRFWGDGLDRVRLAGVNEALLDWARTDPNGLRAAARELAEHGPGDTGDDAPKLMAVLRQHRSFVPEVLQARPEALKEAVEIVIRRPDALRAILSRFSYTDPASVGGYLDRDLSPM